MALSRIKIGDIVTVVDKKNTENCDYPFYGININKEFMPSVANTSNVDRKKYKVIIPNRFVFSGMQTGRDNCIRIGIYTGKSPVLVSPAYTTFEVTNSKVLPLYFFMIFRSKEMDRYGAFLSDSSVRSNLDWDRFCDIELEVPSIEIQKKYVAIYEGLLANLRSYEKGLDDLKLVCDGYIEDLRRKYGQQEIGQYIVEVSNKNKDCEISKVFGISKDGFITPKQKPGNLSNYYIFGKDDFVYSPPRINVGSIGIYKDNDNAICSPIYVIFRCKDKNKLHPDYLMMWLKRAEFLRSTDFYSIGSVRNNFSFDLMQKVKISIPDIYVQNNIVKIFNSFIKRKEYIDKLKQQISSICPILIGKSRLEGIQDHETERKSN